jgi:hypothetical protein
VRMRCPSALLWRGSLIGECYSSEGSRLSVWCLRLRGLAILGGGRCCVTLCMFLSIVVDTSVKFKSVCSVSFLKYQGALVIRRRTRF